MSEGILASMTRTDGETVLSPVHAYAIFSAQYAPHAGGVESFTQRLAHELAMQGNRVFVVTSQLSANTPAYEVQDDGVEVCRLPCRPLLDGRLPISRKNADYQHMLEELATRGIDRVLVNTRFYQLSLEGARFAKRIGVPVIVLDHGSAHLTFGGGGIDWFVERYEHAVTRRMRHLGPAFAGISQASRNWLTHFGIETAAVIPNAIDVEQFKDGASERDFRDELHAHDKTFVAFVGRLEPEKGALPFAQAATLLGDGFVCALAGDGSQREQIACQGFDNVALLGKLDQADLSALLRDADVFCLPTRSEGFCTSLLEAAAQGCVPVMPHVGGTDEVMGFDPVRHGVMLKSCEPADVAQAIREATAQRASGEDLSAFVAAECCWGKTVDALEVAFTSLS